MDAPAVVNALNGDDDEILAPMLLRTSTPRKLAGVKTTGLYANIA